LFENAEELVFDYDLLESAESAIDVAHQQVVVEEADQVRQEVLRLFELAMQQIKSDVSCSTLDAAQFKRQLDSMLSRFSGYRSSVRKQFQSQIVTCIHQLGEVDQDRAMSLQQVALKEFGASEALSSVRLDPCGMRYLVGAGSQPGRSGSCSDAGLPSPIRLVVIETPQGGRFAMSKQEISWNEFGIYCKATSDCASANPAAQRPAQPVTGVSLSMAQSFARWLTLSSGYEYRIPSLAEWQLATTRDAEKADPNRNCKLTGRGQGLVAVTTGEASSLGLLNAVGNVREWVTDGEQLLSVGGSFEVPLLECTAAHQSLHSGQADNQTGFRLVRVIQ